MKSATAQKRQLINIPHCPRWQFNWWMCPADQSSGTLAFFFSCRQVHWIHWKLALALNCPQLCCLQPILDPPPNGQLESCAAQQILEHDWQPSAHVLCLQLPSLCPLKRESHLKDSNAMLCFDVRLSWGLLNVVSLWGRENPALD